MAPETEKLYILALVKIGSWGFDIFRMSSLNTAFSYIGLGLVNMATLNDRLKSPSQVYILPPSRSLHNALGTNSISLIASIKSL